MRDEDLELLEKQAKEDNLRPLTYAASLLTTALRGQRTAAHEWFMFKAATNTASLKMGKDLILWKPDDLEKEFGEKEELEHKVDRWNPTTKQYERIPDQPPTTMGHWNSKTMKWEE